MSSTGNASAERESAGQNILEVEDLSVAFYVEGEWFPAVRSLSYTVARGEVLAIVGESGSGKTQSSMSLLGLLPGNGRASGSARLNGRELIGMKGSALRDVRGKDMAVIFQEPMTAMNPVYTVGFQLVEMIRTHLDMGPAEAKERALELLRLVEIPEPERRFGNFPHQLSGGQRQRAMIAMALACDPGLLVADEPTTALDVTVQAEILKLMRDLRSRIDAGIVLITHDMGVVADMADRIIVMRQGEVVESGTAAKIFGDPQHAYTKELLAAVPHFGSLAGTTSAQTSGQTSERASAGQGTPAMPTTVKESGSSEPGEHVDVREHGTGRTPVLKAEDLVLEYPKQGRQPAFRAVDGVSFSLMPGEVVGLVGESGSGKSTIGRAVVGLLPVHSGSLEVAGVQMKGARARDLKPLRDKVGIVFQDPSSSLNPRMPIGDSIGEPMYLHKKLRSKGLAQAVEKLLDDVQLPRSYRNRYPHELSGGQKQRVGIARALSLEPTLLVADEPTSALDVSVQATVLELFGELQREHGFASLFISHDLGVIEMVCSRIAVMRHGELVEMGSRDQVVLEPRHEYTQRLVAAVPVPDPDVQRQRREQRDRMIEQAGVS
ncbi:ABC transporter ATP-binding protein [Nocardioidaceae bacterium]|nr:ABC transporter ATP-binding protein [Nocardioidaceae bacterium]